MKLCFYEIFLYDTYCDQITCDVTRGLECLLTPDIYLYFELLDLERLCVKKLTPLSWTLCLE